MSEKDDRSISAQEFFYQYELGFKQAPWDVTQTKEELDDLTGRYMRAICMAIGSGGVYTPEQVRYLKGFVAITNKDQAMVDKVEGLLQEAADYVEVELVEKSSHITENPLLRNGGRVMVYDMLRCCEIAGYPEEQMYAISMIADELGVSEFGMLEKIQAQVTQEAEMRNQRIKLLFPEGHEMLQDKYAGLHKDG